jgi:molybdate transport system substrate-binding protein
MPAADLLVAAAADAVRLEQPLREGFQKAAGGQIRFVFGSSGMLARQIGSGAPYDVYLSANERFVHDLAAQGKLDPQSVRVYALGRVALWSKNRSIRKLSDLGSVGRLSLPNPAHAPYGVAARQALEKEGAWKKLEARIVYAENVRQALQFAESGNVDAAITAWSLVFDRGGILIPAGLHAPIRQAAGVVASSSNRGLAAKFLEYLASQEGRALLARHGLFDYF